METYSESDFTEVRIPMPWGVLAGRWYGDQMVRPILALHGWLDNCGSYAKLAPLLAPHASLLCIDLPGHGYSTHLPAGILYYNHEYVRTILRVMKAYNWEKVSLMGHSMGGSVCFHFAAFYPERVDMIIGLDIIKSFYYPPPMMATVLSHVVEKALVDNERLVTNSGMNEPPSYSFAECEQLLYEGSERSVNIENCKYILERNLSKSQKYPDKYYFSRDGRIKYLGEFNPNEPMAEEMAMRICRVPIPYLVIKGGASQNRNSRRNELVDVLTKHNPVFEIYKLVGATHHLHLNDPEPVAELILEFLRTRRPLEAVKQEGSKALTGKARL